MAEESKAQPQQEPQAPQAAQASPAPAPAAPQSPEVQEVARLLKEQKIDGVDEAELAKMSPAEAAALKEMLLNPTPAPAAAAEPAPAAPKTQGVNGVEDAKAALSELMPSPKSPRGSNNYYLLLVNTAAIVLVAIAMVWLLSTNRMGSQQVPQQQVVTYVQAPAQRQPDGHVPAAPQPQATEPAAMSVQSAQALYSQKKYPDAMAMFRQLADQGSFATEPSERAMADFVVLRLGQCQAAVKDEESARKSYEAAARSQSPIVRAYACYLLAVMELQAHQPMNARMRAYQAAGSAGFCSDNEAIVRECDLIAAWGLTEKVLSFYNRELPAKPEMAPLDPFASLDDAAMRRLVSDGMDKRASAALSPRVGKSPDVREQRRFDAFCAGASLEELLARVAAESGNGVQWVAQADGIRQRQVFMACTGAGEQRIYEVACGSAGLLAQFTGQDVRVHNPADAAIVNDQRDALAVEAGAAWRRLFMRQAGEKRLIHGHMAVAAMTECSGDALGAIAEYQIAANQYPKDALAPQAILRSAKVRISLRDFAGARKDLSGLLDNYPDCPASDQAHLALAQASLDAGMAKEAADAFEKLYNAETSQVVKAEACRGAGKSHFQNKKYKEASQWLARYVMQAGKEPTPELLEAYCLLGKSESARGLPAEASQALFLALGCQPPPEQKTDILLEIASLQVQRQLYSKSIGVLRELQNQKLTDVQHGRVVLLYGKTLNAMGLADDGVTSLRKGLRDVQDAELRVAIGMELSRSYAAVGQLRDAHKLLSDMLGSLKGAQAHEASCELAEICLKLAKPEQAQSLMTAVLADEKVAPATARRARELLASAYANQSDYRSTVAALASGGKEPKKDE